MNARERLIRQAEGHLDNSQPVPMDLAAALMDEGVMVENLERKHRITVASRIALADAAYL